MTASNNPGFACHDSDGENFENFGKWFGTDKPVTFVNDVLADEGAGQVVTNVTCQIAGTLSNCLSKL